MTRIIGIAPILSVVFALLLGLMPLGAQTGNIQYQVANLIEDVRLLDERLRQMSVQLEDMRRENNRLRELVSDYESQAESQLSKFVTLGQLNQALAKSVAALEKRDDAMKNEIVVEVKKTVEQFAKQIEKAIDIPSIAKPDPNVKSHFSTEGVPENGIPYTVAPGDSLASIAKKFNSRIDWIQNRNMIADPRLLQVGQVILVPQASE